MAGGRQTESTWKGSESGEGKGLDIEKRREKEGETNVCRARGSASAWEYHSNALIYLEIIRREGGTSRALKLDHGEPKHLNGS